MQFKKGKKKKEKEKTKEILKWEGGKEREEDVVKFKNRAIHSLC